MRDYSDNLIIIYSSNYVRLMKFLLTYKCVDMIIITRGRSREQLGRVLRSDQSDCSLPRGRRDNYRVTVRCPWICARARRMVLLTLRDAGPRGTSHRLCCTELHVVLSSSESQTERQSFAVLLPQRTKRMLTHYNLIFFLAPKTFLWAKTLA